MKTTCPDCRVVNLGPTMKADEYRPEVQPCPKHAMVDELAEALRRFKNHFELVCCTRDDEPYFEGVNALLAKYDTASKPGRAR